MREPEKIPQQDSSHLHSDQGATSRRHHFFRDKLHTKEVHMSVKSKHENDWKKQRHIFSHIVLCIYIQIEIDKHFYSVLKLERAVEERLVFFLLTRNENNSKTKYKQVFSYAVQIGSIFN